MQLFYQPGLPDVQELDQEEASHALRVLRKRSGDLISLTDGRGHLYEARITEVKSKACRFELVGEPYLQPVRPYHIHIALAPTKNMDRNEWFVEKCTELGVDEISFILTANSERRQLKIDRLQKKALSAMKQSGNLYLPQLHDLRPFDAFMQAELNVSQAFVAYVDEQHQRQLKTEIKPGGRYCILIGPEGDFTAEEISSAIAQGYAQVSLGQSRLRTETAGIAACHTFHLMQ